MIQEDFNRINNLSRKRQKANILAQKFIDMVVEPPPDFKYGQISFERSDTEPFDFYVNYDGEKVYARYAPTLFVDGRVEYIRAAFDFHRLKFSLSQKPEILEEPFFSIVFDSEGETNLGGFKAFLNPREYDLEDTREFFYGNIAQAIQKAIYT